MDKDGNGKVSFEEVLAYLQVIKEKVSGPRDLKELMGLARKQVNNLDTNKDGYIDLEEQLVYCKQPIG